MAASMTSRAIYLSSALAALLSQHAATALAYLALGQALPLGAEFWILPIRAFAKLHLADAVLPPGLGFALAASGVAAWLSLRQARRLGRGYEIALLSVVPGLQFLAIPALAALPSAKSGALSPEPRAGFVGGIVGGLLVGMGLAVFAVTLAAMVFGLYGWGLFVFAPFLMGLSTGYIANRRTALTPQDTTTLVLVAASLGGLLLMLFAFEGAICLVMASPIALLAAWFGGGRGREIALDRRAKVNPAAFSLAVLPLVMAMEAAVPSESLIESREDVVVDASPAEVWRAVTHMDRMDAQPALPFRLGLAYPMGGELRSEGLGAERIGRFSTGDAREEVTVWRPQRQLAFRLLTQPPSMHELSPWKTVHAPHVQGYFTTDWTSFDIAPLPDGRSRLTLRAHSRLRLDPAPYWEPMARWAVAANSRRVLGWLRRSAETPPVAAAPPLR